MIFVYPTLVSKNVDWKVLPAILKVVERFFLVQIGQSFGSGSLRIKTEWDESKRKYSELMLENAKITDKEEVLFNFLNEAVNIEDLRKRLKKINDEVDSRQVPLQRLQNEYDGAKDSDDKQSTPTTRRDLATAKNELMKEKSYIDSLEKSHDRISKEIAQIERHEIEQSKEEREKEKYEKEKEAGTKEKYKTHAAKFEVVRTKGVSLDPSMANMEVMIHYVGGPATSDVGHSGLMKSQNISIGCQMAPATIKNFDEFQDVLLDDYFSTKSEIIFKQIYRDLIRTSDRIIDKIYQYATGDVKSKNLDPDVKQDVLYAPRGFLDASSFKRKAKTPKFYNYAAAVVVFNKSDITGAEDENIFENQAQLQRMFRAGWNSFAIIDSTQEEVTFISMLDGGFIHKLSFSYIFNSLEAKDVFDNLDALKRSASPFQRSMGNFRNLGKFIAKENTLVKSILKFMNG